MYILAAMEISPIIVHLPLAENHAEKLRINIIGHANNTAACMNFYSWSSPVYPAAEVNSQD